MATPTYQLITSYTLGSNAASISISSLPPDYRDLIVIAETELATSNSGINYRLNGDSGSYYWGQVFEAYGSFAVGRSYSSGGDAVLYWNQQNAGTDRGIQYLEIFDYAQTDRFKTVLGRGGNASLETGLAVFTYERTSAVNAIELRTGSGTLIEAGTTVNIYGVIA